MSAYYNEFKPEAAHMLRTLIRDGFIADGEVDERSIEDVRAEDLVGFTQCHFFAGIGGWPLALEIAGWPRERGVWTGSCPCQPYSLAGNQEGEEDERHLAPVWLRLIEQCRPSILFGEQVKNAIAHGWADEVFSILERCHYACCSAVLPAYCVQKPHERYRLFFAAYAERLGQQGSEFRLEECALEKRQQDIALHPAYSERYDFKNELPQSVIPSGVDGISELLACVHAFGNAIVPEAAARFILASEAAQSDVGRGLGLA